MHCHIWRDRILVSLRLRWLMIAEEGVGIVRCMGRQWGCGLLANGSNM